MEKLRIKGAKVSDAAKLREIYAPYVEKTAISFEYSVPSLAEFEKRISGTLEKYPYIYAEIDGEIVGYAYASPLKARPAYNFSAETTIYVKEGLQKRGIGRALCNCLERLLAMQNVTNLYACVAYPDEEDEFLTKNSFLFHEHMLYRPIGEFIKCGYKFGNWYNMVWMEKIIANHSPSPEPFIAYSDLHASLSLFENSHPQNDWR